MEGTTYSTHGHEGEVSGHAPGDLELVRSFLSLHDHSKGGRDSLPPSAATTQAWLRAWGGLTADASPADLAWAAGVLDDLRSKVSGTSEAGAPGAPERLNDAARQAGLTICFGCTEDAPVHTEATGVRGAVGRLLGIAFLSELDGSWERLSGCANQDCRSVFWDRSKNRSGRWCSMDTCGNQAKVRAYRARERAAST